MESMQPPVAKRRPVSDINVVPYIDVMLVLLIIFMVTAPMLVQSVPVNLPEVDSSPTEVNPDDSPLIISVDQQGRFYIERDEKTTEAMSLTETTEYVRKISTVNPGTRVLIRGDEAVPYGKVVVLMGNLQGVGVTNVGLVTESPELDSGR